MKKIALAFLLSILFFTGCRSTDDSGIIEIKEDTFLGQINEIVLNNSDYLGKTIELEGFIKRNHWNEQDYYFVIRNTTSCNNGEVGFEISWDSNLDASGHHMDERSTFPEVNEWVKAVGELRSYDFMGYPFLYLALDELTVLETRGIEYVIQ